MTVKPITVRPWRNGRRAALRSLWGKTRGSSSLLGRTITFIILLNTHVASQDGNKIAVCYITKFLRHII